MGDPVVVSPPGPDAIAVARRLDGEVLRRAGHEALPSAVWRDLAHPTEQSALVFDAGPPNARTVVHTSPSDSFAARRWQVAYAAGDGASNQTILDGLERAAEFVGVHGGHDCMLWVPGADDATDAMVHGAQFTLAHEQFQMRVRLPLPEVPLWPDGITVRGFVVGQDEDSWLAVNNRAFANHPDQGDWVRTTLEHRMTEPWFDPAGLLLAFDRDGLAGSCWTKVHPPNDVDPQLGEIFVIGVDPDRQGAGLGRALVVGGLDYLANKRGCATGVLYVDAANDPAVGLYQSLGFMVHRADRAYERSVQAST